LLLFLLGHLLVALLMGDALLPVDADLLCILEHEFTVRLLLELDSLLANHT